MKHASGLFLLFVSTFIFFCGNISFAQQEYKIGLVGFYNLENLFDTLNQEEVKDEDFLPDGDYVWNTEKYYDKLSNIDRVLTEIGTNYSPDGLAVIGVSEIENRSVLEDLVIQKGIKSRDYQIIHEDSPDKRGIDVALLYQAKYFDYEGHKLVPVPLIEKEISSRPTRSVLHVWGKFDGDDFHFLVNHWPSRSGGEAASAPKRKLAAATARSIVDSIFQQDDMAKVIIMGDLNDDPISPSVKKVIGTKPKKKKVKKSEFYNPFEKHYKKGIGSNAWRDSWNLFDQMLLSYGIINTEQQGYRHYKSIVFNPSYLISKTGNFKGYPFRTFAGSRYQGGFSDHLPVFTILLKPNKD
jgi:hypothetical protein